MDSLPEIRYFNDTMIRRDEFVDVVRADIYCNVHSN